jgi:uncharacterized membrane protein YedE/YeeE
MSIDWLHFTPLASLAGGLLIGLGAALLLLANGRIAGISGIVGGLLRPARGDIGWRLAFLLGLLASPLLVAAGGLLVGIGTRLGGGCTSGHGICGIARLSKRSIAATATFMATAIVVVFVARHVIGA